MLPRVFERCLLRPEDLPASQDDLKVAGVFNPGVIATPDGVVMLVRVAESVRTQRPGYVGLPRWDLQAGRTLIDWVKEDTVELLDPRVVRVKATGLLRLTFISHLRLVRCGDGRQVEELDAGYFHPAAETELYGVEDPRITFLDGRYYITYVAVSPHGAATALASTTDFQHFERHGIIFSPENKDVVLFPERIGGRFWALHRPTTAHAFCRPEMWVARSPDLLHWGQAEPFLGATGEWDVGRVGAGAPPLRTPHGWLELYHGNNRREGDPGIGVYSGGALLLDLEDPRRMRKVRGEVLTPERDYERTGFVPDVVFPTGVVDQGETLLVYYGAADCATAVVEWRWRDLWQALGVKA